MKFLKFPRYANVESIAMSALAVIAASILMAGGIVGLLLL
jgi:hypothetical protein